MIPVAIPSVPIPTNSNTYFSDPKRHIGSYGWSHMGKIETETIWRHCLHVANQVHRDDVQWDKSRLTRSRRSISISRARAVQKCKRFKMNKCNKNCKFVLLPRISIKLTNLESRIRDWLLALPFVFAYAYSMIIAEIIFRQRCLSYPMFSKILHAGFAGYVCEGYTRTW